MQKAVTGMVGLVLTLTLGVVLSGPTTFAQQPPQGGGARGGGGRGLSLPPLLMETTAFPDGGIIPGEVHGPRRRAARGSSFKRSDRDRVVRDHLPRPRRRAERQHARRAALDGLEHCRVGQRHPEGSLPPGSVQGNNLMGQPNYMGPGAPPGPRYHHYVFELYALNANLELPATASRDDLLKAMEGEFTAKSAYVGRFRQGEAPAK